jgi:hypothetical protein
MRVIVDVYRDRDGRLEGTLQTPDGQQDGFSSTLDLLRVLEGLDLRRPRADSADELGYESDEEETHG